MTDEVKAAENKEEPTMAFDAVERAAFARLVKSTQPLQRRLAEIVMQEAALDQEKRQIIDAVRRKDTDLAELVASASQRLGAIPHVHEFDAPTLSFKKLPTPKLVDEQKEAVG